MRVSNSKIRNAIEGEIYVVEPLGAESIVNIKLGSDIVKAKSSALTDSAVGKKAWVEFNESKIQVFSQDGHAVSG